MTPTAAGTRTAPTGLRLPQPPMLVMLVGLAAMALPTIAHLARNFWAVDEQGHGPVILLVSIWLLWRQREAMAALPRQPAYATAFGLLLVALLGSVIGRSQDVVQLEVLGSLSAGAALLLLGAGWAGLRRAALPLLFLLFVVPLPGVFVQTITVPLKMAVSYVAEWLMHGLGYPVARTGVILAVDQYRLLVADACAGLTSMFTLEALGLMYVNLRDHGSRLRNMLLAVLIIPIAFAANVIRVVILVLVTYHFGDAAGQGFVHGFAGLVLFVVATMMMLGTDAVLGRVLPQVTKPRGASGAN